MKTISHPKKEEPHMFAFGQAQSAVFMGKVSIPKEFNLNRKGRQIFGAWTRDGRFCLSDDENILKTKVARSEDVSPIKVDSLHRIRVPKKLEGCRVFIEGRISTIDLKFVS